MGGDHRDGDRVPAFLRVKLKYANVDAFVEKYSTNISRGGIFIASRTPKPVGSPLRFELCLQDASKLISGEGVVTWVKEYDEKNPLKAHGMGVRFTRLDPESRALVERMLAFKERRGETPSREPQGANLPVAEATPIPAQRPRRATPPPERLGSQPNSRAPREPTVTQPTVPVSIAQVAAHNGSWHGSAGDAPSVAQALAAIAGLGVPSSQTIERATRDLVALEQECALSRGAAEAAAHRAPRDPDADTLDALLVLSPIDIPGDPPGALAEALGLPPPYRARPSAAGVPQQVMPPTASRKVAAAVLALGGEVGPDGAVVELELDDE